MASVILAFGALWCAVAVAAGAFGAHALADRLDVRSLELWETAARYLMFGGLGAVLVGIAAVQWPRGGFLYAGLSLLMGAAVFSGTVGAIALGAPRWLGAVTPIGGVLMIAGFLLFAWTALRL
jgi:uncharacterized membrane protein YgdD (TMEM256/DUF423 family)